MKIFRLVVLFSMLSMAGCASNLMQLEPNQERLVPQSQVSQLIFMRPSYLGAAIKASLYDVSTEPAIFIGILSSGKKVAYQSPQGKRTFMVVSEAADFMEAELLPEKSYFAVVTPRMGAWKARFSLWPVSNNRKTHYRIQSDEFEEWQKNTKFVSNTDESRAWFEQNKASIKSKQLQYWTVWQQKSAKSLSERTLIQGDGI